MTAPVPHPALSEADVQRIIRRLRRIEGQARGVQKMVSERQACGSVLTQLEAMRAALQRTKVELSICHVRQSLADQLPELNERAAALIGETISTLSRL